MKALIKQPRTQAPEATNRSSTNDILDKIANSAINPSFKNELSKAISNPPQLNQQQNQNCNSQGSPINLSSSDLNQLNKAVLIESNLCHQVGLVIINILSLLLIHQKVFYS